MGGSCQICGYNKCLTALEFHHLNPNLKDISFSKNANQSWQTIRKELPKAILVCANCHREIHGGYIDNSLLKSSFIEERAEEIDELVKYNKTVHKSKIDNIIFCKNCGKAISSKSKNSLCIDCYNTSRSYRPNREELINFLMYYNIEEIGRSYGVSGNAVRKWCVLYNLPYKRDDLKGMTEKDWEKLKFV